MIIIIPIVIEENPNINGLIRGGGGSRGVAALLGSSNIQFHV